jgi:hypothetical protein
VDALDSRAERDIQAEQATIAGRRTTPTIAHRLSTIVRVNQNSCCVLQTPARSLRLAQRPSWSLEWLFRPRQLERPLTGTSANSRTCLGLSNTCPQVCFTRSAVASHGHLSNKPKQ